VKITEITRQALLDHATDVFAESGFDGASVREITRRATINLAAINYHFGGKEALYREVLRLAVDALSDASLLDEVTIDRVTREEAVRLFIRQQVMPLLKHGQISRYWRIFAWETLSPTPVYRDFIASEKLPLSLKIDKSFIEQLAADLSRMAIAGLNARGLLGPDSIECQVGGNESFRLSNVS